MNRSLALALVALGLAQPAAAQDGERRLSGALTYLARIALPPDARVAVVAHGAFGTTLGEARFATQGAQVPLAFELTMPPGLAGRVEAVVRVGGKPRWILQDAGFGAGAEVVDLGELMLSPITPLAFATRLVCGDERAAIGILEDQAVLRVAGRDIPLREAVFASGARYVGTEDPEVEVFTKGGRATIRIGERTLPECEPEAPPMRARYGARGNEPGWSVALEGDKADLAADYGAIRQTVARPAPRPEPGAYVFDMPEAGARLTVRPGLCRDDATGMPYPDRAELELGARRMTGCGGDPASLLTGGEWRIENIAGMGLIDRSNATIAFTDTGRVAGSTGCNRFFGVGGYTLTGEGMSLGQMGSTLMACPEPLMQQERRMLDTLAEIRRFDIDDTGALLLIGGSGDVPLLLARRP